MENLDLKEMAFTIKMPIDETYKVIACHKKNLTLKETVIMIGISEKDFENLKHDKTITVKKGEERFVIAPEDALCFGPIDFHEGSADCKDLDTFDWFNDIWVKGKCIPAYYNYDKHECVSPYKKYMYTETFVISKLCRYLHACLNKPQFTLIFRELV